MNLNPEGISYQFPEAVFFVMRRLPDGTLELCEQLPDEDAPYQRQSRIDQRNKWIVPGEQYEEREFKPGDEGVYRDCYGRHVQFWTEGNPPTLFMSITPPS